MGRIFSFILRAPLQRGADRVRRRDWEGRGQEVERVGSQEGEKSSRRLWSGGSRAGGCSDGQENPASRDDLEMASCALRGERGVGRK